MQGLDFRAGVVSFAWSIVAPNIVGHVNWEVRVDNLADGRAGSAGEGVEGEACTGGGPEYSRVETPISVGEGALFSELDRSECYARFTSTLYSYRAGAAHPNAGKLSGYVLAIARDGNALYALQAPKQPGMENGPGCSTALPCELEQIPEPRLTEDSKIHVEATTSPRHARHSASARRASYTRLGM